MMRKWIAMLLILPILLLAGCSSQEKNLGDDYLLDTDDQYYLRNTIENEILESEDSYYVFGFHYLYSIDKKTGAETPVCNKPDCLHDNEPDDSRRADCNAYFPAQGSMAYYQDKLYIVDTMGFDLDEKESVYEVDLSGSGRKKIYQAEKTISTMIVHRGYLYISFSDFIYSNEVYEKNPDMLQDSSCEVVRIPIDNPSQEPETVWKVQGVPAQVNVMSAYGNRVYMTISNLSEDADALPRMVIYNILNHNTTESKGLSWSNSVRWDDAFIAFPKTLDDKKAQLADADGSPKGELDFDSQLDFYSNDQYLVVDNESLVRYGEVSKEDRAIQIYDKEMNLVKEIKLGTSTLPGVGIDQQYFFYLHEGEDPEVSGTDIWAIDLSRLDEADLEGEPFFTYVAPNSQGMVMVS